MKYMDPICLGHLGVPVPSSLKPVRQSRKVGHQRTMTLRTEPYLPRTLEGLQFLCSSRMFKEFSIYISAYGAIWYRQPPPLFWSPNMLFIPVKTESIPGVNRWTCEPHVLESHLVPPACLTELGFLSLPQTP